MKTNILTQTSHRYLVLALVLLVGIVSPVIVSRQTEAAVFDRVFVRFDRMKQNEWSSGTVCVEPVTATVEDQVRVTFPTGYTVSTTGGDWTTNTTNTGWPASAQAWTGVSFDSASGQSVTFDAGNIDQSANVFYCFNWTNNTSALRIKNSATSSNQGSVATLTSSADVDTGTYTTASITDDQIVVTATVPAIFSFALSANSDALGALTTSAVTTSPTPRTATINTNAKNGWMVWARDVAGNLSSASASANIPALAGNNTLTAPTGTSAYNTGITSSQGGGSGTITVASTFVGTGAGQGGGLSSTLQTLATSSGTADTAVLTIKNNVVINATQAAATDYTDTITVVGAGLF